jgi:hypothetical protein
VRGVGVGRVRDEESIDHENRLAYRLVLRLVPLASVGEEGKGLLTSPPLAAASTAGAGLGAAGGSVEVEVEVEVEGALEGRGGAEVEGMGAKRMCDTAGARGTSAGALGTQADRQVSRKAGLVEFAFDVRLDSAANWEKGRRETGGGTDLGACASLLGLAPAASSFAVDPVVPVVAPLALARPRTAERAIGLATVGEEVGAVVGLLGVAEEWE